MVLSAPTFGRYADFVGAPEKARRAIELRRDRKHRSQAFDFRATVRPNSGVVAGIQLVAARVELRRRSLIVTPSTKTFFFLKKPVRTQRDAFLLPHLNFGGWTQLAGVRSNLG